METRRTDGTLASIPYLGDNPGGAWKPWVVELPAGIEAFRIHGSDGATTLFGWLGFSTPGDFGITRTWMPKMLLQTLGCCALAMLLLFGPGLVLHARGRIIFADIIWPGPLALLAGGVLTWLLGGIVPPWSVATIWVAATVMLIAGLVVKLRVWEKWTHAESLTLGLAALAILGAAAKAATSVGPAGELYGGRVSRTLEVGGHSDSRISFHTVQLVANHLAPHGPEAEAMFAPWGFSRRGPVAGLIAAPISIATIGRPPIDMPDQPWVPFDREGFSAYRIALIALSALSLVAVSGLLAQFSGARAALLGTGLIALAPFFWHELYFTWPKMIAAAWVLGSFSLMHRHRLVLAGVALAAAYLQHPMALLSAPFLALWLMLGVGRATAWPQRAAACVKFGLGCVSIIALWQLLNAGHVTQHAFLDYFRMSDGGSSTIKTWLESRWRSIANTLIPLHVWALHGDHPSFTALDFRSSRLVQFFLQYWSTAPFAVGIVAWVALLPRFVRALARNPTVAGCLLVGPFFFLVVYWGAATTGLMREAGHVLFLTGWVFFVWASADELPRWISSHGFAGARALETLAMMFAPSLQSLQADFLTSGWLLNDIVWFSVSVMCTLAAAATSARAMRCEFVGPLAQR